jgi:hypothetical protein
MGRATWPLKIGSLVLHSPPLRVGFADEVLEEVLRRQNSWDVLRKRHEWLVIIGVDQAGHGATLFAGLSKRVDAIS